MNSPEPITRMPGYHGCCLRVDLSTGQSRRVPLDSSVLRGFLGGSGLGVYLLLKEQAAPLDPLSAEAPLVFVFSPLVGSPLTTSAKFAVVSKSPLTQRINDSLASSQFAISGKRTGCDAIIVVGRASRPSVLIVDDGQVRLEPADELWGLTCSATENQLRENLGGDYQCAVIGPAGEKLVRYATISHDRRHAGRGGSGAVMGAKNLKAIAVRGTQRCDWAHPDQLFTYSKELSKKSFGPATAKYRELGTATNLLVFNRLGTLPSRNFQQGSLEGVEQLAPEQMSQTRNKTRASCACCTIGCEHIYSLRDDKKPGVRMEYESLFALGPLCGMNDPEIVLEASHRCDELGMDTISTGGTIAFAMECVERGLLDAPWLQFGDGPSLLKAIDQIATREDLGDLLAEGSRITARKIGSGSMDFAPQVKGLELPGYEPRVLQTMALGFAVGTRGADHNRSGAYEVDFSEKLHSQNSESEVARLAIETEDKAALMDSLVLCKFLRGIFEDFFADASRMLNLVTGWDTTPEELHQTARRIVSAKKQFNILAGWRPDEDMLPERFLETPLPGNHPQRPALPRERLAAMVEAYNLQRGWTHDGWIKPEQLDQLGLNINATRVAQT